MEFLAVIVVVYLAALAWSHLKKNGRKLPPGPYPLPIVGNIFQVAGDANVHKTFAQLSKKYGPLMSIRIGSVLNVVASSPETAKAILSKPESADKPIFQALYSHDHIKLSMGFVPVTGRKWKDMRKICREQMFTNQSLRKSQWLRHKKQLQLIDHVQKRYDAGGAAVNIREAAFTTTLNLISAALFSVDVAEFDSPIVTELKDILMQITTAFAAPNIVDNFPILRFFDPQGVRRQTDRVFGRLFRHVQTYIDRRLESRRADQNHRKPDDLLETLLDSMAPGSGYDLTLDDITHLLFDLYNAGSESSMMTIEWAMTELLLHPDKLSKAQDEVRKAMEGKKVVEEEDISRLPYLQGVMKETLRLHMPAPLLFPHIAREDMEINGYFIPKNTKLMVNAWAIARDPSLWLNPESFEPERFLNGNIDVKGQHFQLIPFGSGKRICPGLPLADRIGHTIVAALIHNFDWKFAPGESERNGEVLSGPALRREAPLMAIPMRPWQG